MCSAMSDQAPPVSIVIPARNEAARLPASLRQMREVFPDEPWEFLVIVEPSSDGTAGLAREAVAGDRRFEVVENAKAGGKGYAVKTGMLRARGDWIFFMDADLSVPLRYVKEYLGRCGDADVLIGSRRHPESVVAVHQPFLREASGRFFNIVLRLSGATALADTQCGFKAFRREAVQKIFPLVRQDGFGFDVEVVALAEVLGFRLREMPVEWADAPGSKVRPLQDGVTALVDAVLATRRVRREYSHHALTRS